MDDRSTLGEVGGKTKEEVAHIIYQKAQVVSGSPCWPWSCSNAGGYR